jgi:molybdopterin-guanine dinucleotide biosynthesis protein
MIIIEGYKYEQTPKILVARNAEQFALHKNLSGLLAIATTLYEIVKEERTAADLDPLVPLLNLNDVLAVTAFVENWFHAQRP